MHIYESNGKKLPSVTTIISALGSDYILKWANSLGFRHLKYEDELNKYAERGSLIHDLLRGEVDPSYIPEIIYKDDIQRIEILGYLTKFRNFLSLYNYETLFCEKTFMSETLGYAGTIDWLANINNYLMLNDFKTSKMVKFTHLLQLGGYNNLLKENGIYVDGASIILCNKKVTTMYPINKSQLEFFGDAFNNLANYYLMTWEVEMQADNELYNSLKSTKS